MKYNEFIENLAELLEIDDELTRESPLKGREEFDSLAIMVLVAFIDQNFGKTVPGIELVQVEKVSDLIELIGEGLID